MQSLQTASHNIYVNNINFWPIRGRIGRKFITLHTMEACNDRFRYFVYGII